MIDKMSLLMLGIAGAGKLLAETAGDGGLGMPSLSSISNLTATGALIFLVIWMTTQTLPAIVKDFREETALIRADRDKERDRVVCQHKASE